jgi:hypothetical protein
MKLEGPRSMVFGYHNIILHGLFVSLAWIKIYRKVPTAREFICILLHDIGYIFQDEVDSVNDKHPLLGANICGKLFGHKYYNLCIGHSRAFAVKRDVELSKLCYADKYCILIMPIRLQYVLSKFDNGINVYKLRGEYLKWWKENCHGIKNWT